MNTPGLSPRSLLVRIDIRPPEWFDVSAQLLDYCAGRFLGELLRAELSTAGLLLEQGGSSQRLTRAHYLFTVSDLASAVKAALAVIDRNQIRNVARVLFFDEAEGLFRCSPATPGTDLLASDLLEEMRCQVRDQAIAQEFWARLAGRPQPPTDEHNGQ